ncbi:CxxxxCH/CxxCH domain-containing protein [Pandoraea sp.]|uniref:CxxxxCH/CxxCH domain-containing protein n=1 Tax=Pandoraea sp. TaxID=1883445 RepID=UPI00344D08C2
MTAAARNPPPCVIRRTCSAVSSHSPGTSTSKTWALTLAPRARAASKSPMDG